MESIFTELALYGSKTECARTDIVFSPISEVCNGTVSLWKKFSFLIVWGILPLTFFCRSYMALHISLIHILQCYISKIKPEVNYLFSVLKKQFF